MKLASLGLILFFALGSNDIRGQYLPMVEEGKFWIYLNHLDEDHPKPVSGFALTFQGDTTINSLRYKKVYLYGLAGEHNCPFPPCFQFDIPYQTLSKSLISFIREDTASKKVYNLPLVNADLFCQTDEHLIFDYSIAIGDTLNSCIYDFVGAGPDYPSMGLVDSIHVVTRFGKARNTIFTAGIPWYGGLAVYGQILLLEGVGLENYGLFHEPLIYLVDFCEGGMEACEIVSSTSMIEDRREVSIFPNPTKGIVQVSVEEEELKSIRIYSMTGVFKAEYLHTNTIDLSNFEEGFYFLELISEKGERMVKKIAKAN